MLDADVMSDSKAVIHRASLTRQDIQIDNMDEDSDSESVSTVEESNVNFLHIPGSPFGVIRQLSTVVFRCTGLRLTDTNAEDLLPSGLGDQTIGACARELLHHITRWEDIVVVDAVDLGNLEHTWVGANPSSFHKYRKPTESEFLVKLQYRSYVDSNWRIIRELSYLAISPAAVPVLTGLAANQRKLPGLYSLGERLRHCPNAVLRETIDCLRSGSAWQVLRAALSSSAFYLQPCSDANDHKVAHFSLGYVRSTQFSDLLQDLAKGFSSRHKCYTACSILTSLDNDVSIEDPPHDDFSCRRCLASCQNAFAVRDWNPAHFSSRPISDAVLVSALKPEERDRERQDRHDLCLYLLDKSPALSGGTPFSTIIEQLAKEGQIYHTILHGHPNHNSGPDGVFWNLPWPYRKSTRRQQFDIARWVHDLAEYGSPFTEKQPTSWMYIWVHQQMLLYYLRKGMDYDDADEALRAFRNESRGLYRGRHNLPFGQPNLPLWAVQLSRFWAKIKQEGDSSGGMLD